MRELGRKPYSFYLINKITFGGSSNGGSSTASIANNTYNSNAALGTLEDAENLKTEKQLVKKMNRFNSEG